MCLQRAAYFVCRVWIDDNRHPDAAIEGSLHFGIADAPRFGEPTEYRFDRPATGFDLRSEFVTEYARQILRQSPARDMRKSMHTAGF